jgi:hypothetical protein
VIDGADVCGVSFLCGEVGGPVWAVGAVAAGRPARPNRHARTWGVGQGWRAKVILVVVVVVVMMMMVVVVVVMMMMMMMMMRMMMRMMMMMTLLLLMLGGRYAFPALDAFMGGNGRAGGWRNWGMNSLPLARSWLRFDIEVAQAARLTAFAALNGSSTVVG